MVGATPQVLLGLLGLIALVGTGHASTPPPAPSSSPPKEQRASTKLPPCAACQALVTSFELGMERTLRGRFDGGDVAWEEKNQVGGYASSEVRLVEIQERLCQDVDRGQIQCHDNHHHWEEDIERWWQLQPVDTRPGLRAWLCVEELKVCCPEGHFGADCQACRVQDEAGLICSGSGQCKGGGTRKGNGRCACDRGYGGERCERCGVGYYESYKDTDKALCSPCHKSCLGHCTGSGPKSCAACQPGYTLDQEHGCTDVDECHQGQPCQGNKFCVNTEGTYQCLLCDKSCQGCEGDGPDACLACAEGYVSNPDGMCISEQTAAEPSSGKKSEL
eukprot:maker-scaffold67_size430214-snap-gene-0.10 protein:Tk00763 transcript:maker-scaffold67_size430214-snap-gene-0.10-mRNA-1 annotation:"cysteine-rich with egf-like domain protein 2"